MMLVTEAQSFVHHLYLRCVNVCVMANVIIIIATVVLLQRVFERETSYLVQ